MLHVDLGTGLAHDLQSVKEATQPPRPLTIGAIVLQCRIETIEVMLSPFMMSSELSVVVHLLLMERHDGDILPCKELSRQ